MARILDPSQFLLVAIGGWMNRHQRQTIEYLREENRVLREHWVIVDCVFDSDHQTSTRVIGR